MGNTACWHRTRPTARRALLVLAAGAFAVGTDAFVIAGILPAVVRGVGVSVSWFPREAVAAGGPGQLTPPGAECIEKLYRCDYIYVMAEGSGIVGAP